MRTRFTERAISDLEDIADFIAARSPRSAVRVRDAILRSLSVLTDFPRIGRLQDVENIRKLITAYDFVVYYTVDAEADEIAILTIQHPSRDREFNDL